MERNEQLEEFFENNPPERVIEITNDLALEYLCTSPDIPEKDRQRFNMLHDLKQLASQQLKQKGGSDE